MDIVLRPWIHEDIDTFMSWMESDPKIAEAMSVEGVDELEVRKNLVLSMASPTMQRFMATRDGDAVAAIAIYDIRADRTAFASIVAKPDSTGFATVASSKRTLKALFNGLGFVELRVVVSERNEPALKLAKMLGFEDENVRQLRLTKDDYDGPVDSTGDRQ